MAKLIPNKGGGSAILSGLEMLLSCLLMFYIICLPRSTRRSRDKPGEGGR